MRINPDIIGCSIVLLGKFNPAIFQPAWLQAKGVEPDASSAKIELVHPEIAQFVAHDRDYRITRERFQISTASGPWAMISDIVYRVFGEYLTDTPIRAFGVNRHAHFQLPSRQARMKLGRLLAPIVPWGEFGAQMEPTDAALTGGLQSLTMRRLVANEGANVQINATVEPSMRLGGESGVYMRVNAHHEITGLPDGYGAGHAVNMLSARFEGLIEEADAIIDNIMEAGVKL